MSETTVTALDELTRSQRRIDDSFGLASWIAVIGVILVWFYVKVDTPVTLAQSAGTSSSVLSTPLQRAPMDGDSMLERGNAAFAAGDIITPENDSALHYYREALAQDPDDDAARQGLEQVIEFLVNEAESAIFHSDWDLARDHASQVLAISPGHRHADELNARAARLKRVEALINRAVELYAAGRLTVPEGENAAANYLAALELDPGNEVAQQGLDSIVQRTIANAESALYAGNMDKARQFLERARALNPDAAGVSALEQTSRSLENLQQDLEVKNDLVAAAEALQADRLMPPDEPSAFTLYNKVLAADPGSEAARRGLQLVRDGLLERAQTVLASDDVTASREFLDAAGRAGADPDAIARLREEAAYRQRLLDAQAGRFDSLYPIAEVTPVRQTPPTYPRAAPVGASGSVSLHLTITETGDVRDVEVINDSPDYFERAAVKAVSKWKFEPVMERGRPIPVRVAVKVAFQG